MNPLYAIESWMPEPIGKWHKLTGFNHLQKSYALGAWAMLKAHYGQRTRYRLIKDGEVIDECGLRNVSANTP